MKQIVRIILAVTIGIGVFMVGQLPIENMAWWWRGDTATFDDPLRNALKVGLSGTVGLALALHVAIAPVRRFKRS